MQGSGAPALSRLLLLAGSADAHFLCGLLHEHGRGASVARVDDVAALERALPTADPGARLIAYATDQIAPARLLDRCGAGAYNFHPGPPEYPGVDPAALAVLDGAPRFGATAHEMTARVDDGPIIGVTLFDVAPGAGWEAVAGQATHALARLFIHLAPSLCAPARPPRLALSWGDRRSTKAGLAGLRRIDPTIGGEELERRRRALHRADAPLTMVLHGRVFALSD